MNYITFLNKKRNPDCVTLTQINSIELNSKNSRSNLGSTYKIPKDSQKIKKFLLSLKKQIFSIKIPVLFLHKEIVITSN